ncbi:MAG: AMP-binding protein [Sulfitobacter sp.]
MNGFASVHASFANAAARWPDRPFMDVLPRTAAVYGIDAGPLSYDAAMQQVDAWATRLNAAGYVAGMRIALLLENRPLYFVILLAANRQGLSVVPVNPDLRAAELEYMFGHAEPALIIAIPDRISALQSAADAAGLEVTAVTPDQRLPTPRDSAITAHLTDDTASREAAMLYTSGTTGQPKGCVLNNTYFTELGLNYVNMGGIAALHEDGERMITPLPLFHMNAMCFSFMAMLQVGGCLIAIDRFHPTSWWQDVRDSSATCLHYLGVMPSILMGLPETDRDREHSVRFGFGAGIDPELHAPFEQRFGIPLCEGWAMTETGAGAIISNQGFDRLVGQSSLGPVPDWLEVRLVDENGTEVAKGEPGELLVRRKEGDPRKGFFTEYFKNESATAEAWAGGWFHTGDVVRQGTGGNMFFVDRRKNVIRRSSENIAAVEVESVLMRHPDITAAGVAAVPDAVRGDEVFACLSVKGPSPAKAKEIAHWALGQMAYYKVPGYIAFVDALPLTATQKIQRGDLKRQAHALLTHPDTINLTHLKKRQPA